jgi:hypothetical protein
MNIPSKSLERAAEAVIRELDDRRGFDGWWYDLEPDIQQEIKEAIARAIDKSL